MCSTSSKTIFGKGCHLSHSARSGTDFCSLFHFPQFSCGARQKHAFFQNQAPQLQHRAYLKTVITWWWVSSTWQILFLLSLLLSADIVNGSALHQGEQELDPLPWAHVLWERPWGQLADMTAGWQESAFICVSRSATAWPEASENYLMFLHNRR